MRRKKFNDPALDENGVAVEKKETAVETTQEEADKEFTPAAGSLGSFGIEPFPEEDIDKANDVEVEIDENHKVDVKCDEAYQGADEATEEAVDNIETFSDEEIDDMNSEEEIQAAMDDVKDQMETFSARKKKLYSAKLRLKRFSRMARRTKSFAEELSDKEKDGVVEDIVAILEDSPDIKTEVAEKVELIPETDVAPAEEREEVDTQDEEVDVAPEMPAGENEDVDVTAFSDEEIGEVSEEESVEEPMEEESEEEITGFDEFEESEEVCDECDTEDEVPAPDMDEDSEEVEETTVGQAFCKAFANDEIRSFRRSFLEKMSNTGINKYSKRK